MRIGSTLAAILLYCLLGSSASATNAFGEDWTEFRGPTGQGHSTVTGTSHSVGRHKKSRLEARNSR